SSLEEQREVHERLGMRRIEIERLAVTRLRVRVASTRVVHQAEEIEADRGRSVRLEMFFTAVRCFAEAPLIGETLRSVECLGWSLITVRERVLTRMRGEMTVCRPLSFRAGSMRVSCNPPDL